MRPFSGYKLCQNVSGGGTNSATKHDPLRHFAAVLVPFSHNFPLSGLPEPTVPGWDTLGFVAVAMFFSMSGFFMPQSYASAGNFMAFMAKRCRRIFPGLIVCCFLMIYVIGAIFTETPAVDYLFDREQVRTFLMFVTLGGRPVPTVFSDFIFKDAINGSLWTLPVEFGWYIVIGFLLSTCQSAWKAAGALFWLSASAIVVMQCAHFDYAFYGVPATFFALFGVAFATGALLSTTRVTWIPYRLYMVGISLLMLFLMRGRPECQVIGTASLAVLTIVIGVSLKDNLIRGRFDISYGIYICAFPLQQIVINRVTGNFWAGMAISALLTIIAAALSYHLIEKRFLRRHQKETVTSSGSFALAA
ncbi:peptidoglycan/LPS O-acetylase OafA/YrhL [Bradyrhizobium sp. RT9b]|uniref:acyltransferase family protein n=1 Tax=unclassified Bradyrhizobium TaxID=2631580 RepID=UPI0033973416